MPLPPTAAFPVSDADRPYFCWWMDWDFAEFRRRLADPDPSVSAYALAILLREANSRDVWQLTTPEACRDRWPELVRHLGRERARWAWLLGVGDPGWPPAGVGVRA